MKGRKILSALLGVVVFLVFAGKNANTQNQSGISFYNYNDGTYTYNYPTIQDAIDAAEEAVGGGRIEVEAGTYYTPSEPIWDDVKKEWIYFPIIIRKNNVHLEGAGQDVCTLKRNTSGAVIVFDGEVENIYENTIIEGFTITHSDGTTGRGIICQNYSSPTIKNNIIEGNESGGIACTEHSSPTITNNIIRDNTARFNNVNEAYYKGGGGILCKDSSSPTITNNVISGNSTWYFFDPTYYSEISGGGIKCVEYSDATIINNIITNNSAFSRGGGISSMDSSPVIINNTIANNTADQNGGGIACERINYSDSSTIKNNIITGNTVLNGMGGGIYWWWGSSPIITSNNVWNNTNFKFTPRAQSNYVYDEEEDVPQVDVSNNISVDPLFENNSFLLDITIENGTLSTIEVSESKIYSIDDNGQTIEYSYSELDNIEYNNDGVMREITDIYPNSNGRTTIEFSPALPIYSEKYKFVNIWRTKTDPIENFHLQSDSDCIDAGDNNALEISYPHIGFDIEENWRFIDSNTGDYGTIDIGAYEFVPQQTNTPPVADAGPDQTVAADDNCQADVTLDGKGSSDVEDDQDPTTPLTYTWTWEDPVGQAQEASGVQPTVPLGMGIHEITLTVKDSNGATDIDTVDITIEDPPTILLEGPTPILVSIGRWKWKKANKLTVSATDNCSSDVKISIDNVEIFNKKGRPVLGKGVYSIVGHDIYVFPRGRGWSICVTVTATGESGNSVTEIICKTLLKYRGWSWKSFFRLLWRCFH